MRLLATSLLLVPVLITGCGGTIPAGDPLGGEGDYLRGEKLVEQKRYVQAIEVLDAFRNEHPGSDRIDDAIFMLGIAHQRSGDHLLAREEFQRLLRDFPQSDHREQAQYEVGRSWMAEMRKPALDPEPTESALEALRAYLRFYPDGAYRGQAEEGIAACLDGLAVKACLNGQTYLRLKAAQGAQIYFEKSLSIAPESSCAGEAMLGLGRAHEMLYDTEGARTAYRTLLEYATPERIREQSRLRGLRQQAEAALARLEASSGGRS